MAKILFEGIDIRDIEVTPNGGIIKREKKEETPKLEFNDADFYLLESEINIVRKLHKDRIKFYEEIFDTMKRLLIEFKHVRY